MDRRYFHRFVTILLFFFAIQIVTTRVTLAHKGHAGPPFIFMEEGEAIKTMLPKDGKILKRKEELKKEKYKEAVKRWGYSPDAGIHTYYLSRGKSGEMLGALFIRSVEYRHGEVVIAVGYGREGHLTDIKILSCPEKYVKDIRETILNSGFLDNFLHLEADNVIATGMHYNKEPEESIRRILAEEIGETAILLKIFQGF